MGPGDLAAVLNAAKQRREKAAAVTKPPLRRGSTSDSSSWTLDSRQDSQLKVPKRKKVETAAPTITPPEKIRRGMQDTPQESTTTGSGSTGSTQSTGNGDKPDPKQLKFPNVSGDVPKTTDPIPPKGDAVKPKAKPAAAKTKAVKDPKGSEPTAKTKPAKPAEGPTVSAPVKVQPPGSEWIKRSPSSGVSELLRRQSTSEMDTGKPTPEQVEALRVQAAVNAAEEGRAGETKEGKAGKKRQRDPVCHARRMRFYRSLTSENSPSEVIEMAKNARSGSGKKQKLAVMFEDWLTSSEDWDTSKLVVQMREVHSKGRRGSRQWLCRYQIVSKYGGDENIADEIINAKLSLDEKERALVVRDHPDTPLPELRQFLVFDAESEYDSSDSILESLFSATSTEKGGKDKGKKKKRKGSSSSSSDSSCSSDSSGSDSSEKKKKKKKGKKSKKSKKDKKAKGKKGKSKADKEKAKQKQQEKDKKEKDREEEKKKQTVRGEAKKALNLIIGNVQDCAKKETKAVSLSAAVKDAILEELMKHKAAMSDARDKLQAKVDDDELDRMEPLISKVKDVVKDYKEKCKNM